MNTFTYGQKKWAMASALLLVLGFNVSFNNHTGGIASLELASTSDIVPGKITTSAGVANVKYIKTGEKEVLALVPKIAEGKGYCEECGFDRYELNIQFDKNKADIDALNVALLQSIEKGHIADAKAKEDPKDEPVARKIVKAKLSFAEKVNKLCGSDRNSQEALDCRVSEISKIFGDEKVNQKEVTDFYAQWVQQDLARALSSNDQSASSSAMEQLTALQDRLITEKGWKDLRQRLGLTMAASIGYAGNTLRTYYNNYQTAINSKDLKASGYWMNMYQVGQNSIYAAKNNMAAMQTNWANSSLQEQSISYADINTVVWSYSNPAEQIFNQLITSPQTFNFVNGQVVAMAPLTNQNSSPSLPGSISNPGTIVQLPDGSLVAARLSPGRGITNNRIVAPNGSPSATLPVSPSLTTPAGIAAPGNIINLQPAAAINPGNGNGNINTNIISNGSTLSPQGAAPVQYIAVPLSGLADRSSSLRIQ